MASNRRDPSKLLLITLCFCLATNAFALEACPSFCRFRLCHYFFRKGNVVENENRGYLLGVPNTPLGSFPCIVRSGGIQELRNVTAGEARVSKTFVNEFVRISKFIRSEVSPPFVKDYFRWVLDRDGHSNIAKLRSKGNQDEKIDRVCVQMPITSYFTRRGKLRRTKGKSACVGIRAVVPKLLVDFEWNSPDDFDLSLTEPNGDVINRFGENTRSDNGGRILVDNGAEVCAGLSPRERISYLRDATIESGTYTIRVDHNRICDRTTNYRLRVMLERKIILDKRGRVMNTAGPVQEVVVETFTV